MQLWPCYHRHWHRSVLYDERCQCLSKQDAADIAQMGFNCFERCSRGQATIGIGIAVLYDERCQWIWNQAAADIAQLNWIEFVWKRCRPWPAYQRHRHRCIVWWAMPVPFEAGCSWHRSIELNWICLKAMQAVAGLTNGTDIAVLYDERCQRRWRPKAAGIAQLNWICLKAMKAVAGLTNGTGIAVLYDERCQCRWRTKAAGIAQLNCTKNNKIIKIIEKVKTSIISF